MEQVSSNFQLNCGKHSKVINIFKNKKIYSCRSTIFKFSININSIFNDAWLHSNILHKKHCTKLNFQKYLHPYKSFVPFFCSQGGSPFGGRHTNMLRLTLIHTHTQNALYTCEHEIAKGEYYDGKYFHGYASFCMKCFQLSLST